MSPQHHVFYTVSGDAWGMHDNGGFWGPYSKHPDKSRPYFTKLTRALLDGGTFWEQFHRPPADYPFRLLGQPCALIRPKDMGYPRDGIDLLTALIGIEHLTQRLRLLARERDCFCAMAQVNAPEDAQ
jgi:hypothetical protein